MSRAYGWNAQLLIAEEKEYGVPPEENYRKIPFISSSLDSEQNLVSSNVLGLGRDPTQPFQDVINVDGDMAVPVDMRNIGFWLKAIFGAPVTTDNEDGSFTLLKAGKHPFRVIHWRSACRKFRSLSGFPVCAPTVLLLIFSDLAKRRQLSI